MSTDPLPRPACTCPDPCRACATWASAQRNPQQRGTAGRYARGRPLGASVSCLAAVHDELAQRVRAGETYTALAADYGVTPRNIRAYLQRHGIIVPRMTPRHLTPPTAGEDPLAARQALRDALARWVAHYGALFTLDELATQPHPAGTEWLTQSRIYRAYHGGLEQFWEDAVQYGVISQTSVQALRRRKVAKLAAIRHRNGQKASTRSRQAHQHFFTRQEGVE